MAVTNYYAVNAELVGEKTVGSSRIDYLTDALGSVTATLNQSAQVVNTYRYKPYGAQLAKTGTAADPAFTWVGAQGYRQTGRKYSDVYVRARHYSSSTARWTTKVRLEDQLEGEHPYGYAFNNPITYTDPSGDVPALPGLWSGQNNSRSMLAASGTGAGPAWECDALGNVVDRVGRRIKNPSKCLKDVCACIAKLRNDIDNIASALCGGSDEGGAAVLRCGKTQLCIGETIGSCDAEAPPDSPCFVDDTGGLAPHY